MNRTFSIILCVATLAAERAIAAPPEASSLPTLQRQFTALPIEARRLTGPLFWLHGDESPERLAGYLEKVAQGGNGCFTAESRPHSDWLGPGWYRDLGICLKAAKRLDLKMWIFDEQWWPSGEVGGKVPQQYASKFLEVDAVDVPGPRSVVEAAPAEHLVALLAGRVAPGGGIEGNTLLDLGDRVADGKLRWDCPAGPWKLMKFTWRYSEGRHGRLLIDGASRDAVDWYIRTVYQPHFDHFAADFGKTIAGYFYDEPETLGDWGREVIPMLKRRNVDWKLTLADPEQQVAAKYQYQDALAEAWGRTLYGGLADWCRKHHVRSLGHFLEHEWEYLRPDYCAGNMFQLQKYSDLGGVDLVCQQFYPGSKDPRYCQMAKLGSSIAHVYGKADDLAMSEMFGAYGQSITYPQMKWLTDQMQVRGINFMIPHSFNPRAPYDRDCPPFFYNDGYEPRWPLYRVYADYTSRLSLMLSGGRHVCPVAFLFLGNSHHAGKSLAPEQLTTAMQDSLFDCDWLPYDVFENDVRLADRRLHLRREQYRVLVVPAVEVIPWATLAKAHEFFQAGGVVVGYGILPSRSATLGKSAPDVAHLREALWGVPTGPGLKACRTNAAGGRSYFLPEQPTAEQIQQVLVADAGIHPTLEVLEGQTDAWLHVLHREKAGRDVFLICNQQHEGPSKRFRFRAQAAGVPTVWDAMRGEIRSPAWNRAAHDAVEFTITLEPMESALVVFQPTSGVLPTRIEPVVKPLAAPILVERIARTVAAKIPRPQSELEPQLALKDCPWVWTPDAGPGVSAAPGTRWFRKRLDMPQGRKVVTGKLRATADNSFTLYVNGRVAGAGLQWTVPVTIDVAPLLHEGANVLAVAAVNGADRPNPAGLIGRYSIRLDDGTTVAGNIDAAWRCLDREVPGWNGAAFDDRDWRPAKVVARFGDKPWGKLDGTQMLTLSPVKADPFFGRFTLPADWLGGQSRVCLEADRIEPEQAAAIQVNGQYAGGFIGKPFRLDITAQLKPGENTLHIEPFAPAAVRIVRYSR